MTSVLVVHWPDNTDEPTWVFEREEDAHAFAATIADDANVRYEPLFGPEDARKLCASRREQARLQEMIANTNHLPAHEPPDEVIGLPSFEPPRAVLDALANAGGYRAETECEQLLDEWRHIRPAFDVEGDVDDAAVRDYLRIMRAGRRLWATHPELRERLAAIDGWAREQQLPALDRS